MAIMPQSVAIGLRAVGSAKRHSQINLRQGEFAFVQNYESILKAAIIAFRVVAIALVLLCVSYGVKYVFYKRQIDQLQAQYLKDYQAIFPTVKNQYLPGKFTFEKLRSDAAQKLQKEINHKRSAVAQFVEDNASSPALTILKSLSEVLPKELKLEVTLYQYNVIATGGGKLVLRGETDSYALVDKILEAIKTSKVLKSVESKQSGPKPGSDGKIIEFTINADYAGLLGAGGKA
jgi:Tfp pilus assembly protein PilN